MIAQMSKSFGQFRSSPIGKKKLGLRGVALALLHIISGKKE